MTTQTLKIGKREFVLLAKRDFDRLAAKASRQIEEEYWTESALRTEAKAAPADNAQLRLNKSSEN